MRQKSGTEKASAEKVIEDIRRVTRKQYGAEEKIRIVLEGLRGEESIAALCRREGIAESLYYNWSKEFLEAGKKRALDPLPDPIRKRADDFLLDDEKIADLAIVACKCLPIASGRYDR
jgi:transposase-like protein